MFFDAHLHLDDLELEEVEKYISRANKEKVEKLFVNSTNLKTIDFVSTLSKKYSEIVPGFGIYPLESEEKDLVNFEKFIGQVKKPFFIGEIGLDFKFADEDQKKTQMKVFEKQLEIAKEYDVYVNVHSRYAQKQVIELLEKHKQEKVIMHWFCNSGKYVKRAVDSEYYITVGPTYLLRDELTNVVRNITLELLLFETDFPVELSGKPYESCEIPKIAEKYCGDFGIKLRDLEKAQNNNYKTLIK